MKLYYSPGACSLSPHIILREVGAPFELEKVDLRTHTTSDGGDFYRVNPKGYVPALALEDGTLLTEGPAITQYLADTHPDAKVAPPMGNVARYQMIAWLTFIGTELHKNFSPLFHNPSPEVKAATLEKLTGRFKLVADALAAGPYLMGESFTLPDAYLFVVLRWAKRLAPQVVEAPVIQAYFDRMMQRPSVQAALKAEGLH
jgi:glutathione S-transferase